MWIEIALKNKRNKSNTEPSILNTCRSLFRLNGHGKDEGKHELLSMNNKSIAL